MFTLNGVPLGITTAMLALAPAFGAAGPASAAGTIERVSVGRGGVQGDGYSNFSAPALSADGRLVAFVSGATNLVPNDTNGAFDVFVRDRRKRVTSREVRGYGAMGL